MYLFKANMMKQGRDPGFFMVSRTKAASFFQYVSNMKSLRLHKLYNFPKLFYHSFSLTCIFHLLKCLNIFSQYNLQFCVFNIYLNSKIDKTFFKFGNINLGNLEVSEQLSDLSVFTLTIEDKGKSLTENILSKGLRYK